MSSKYLKLQSNQTTRSNTVSSMQTAEPPVAEVAQPKKPKSSHIFNYYYLFDECNMVKLKPKAKADRAK